MKHALKAFLVVLLLGAAALVIAEGVPWVEYLASGHVELMHDSDGDYDPPTDFWLKDFAGTWYAADTSEVYVLTKTDLPNDTLLIVGWTTNATTPYYGALKVRFGTAKGFHAAVVIDSAAAVGTAASANTKGLTTADSVFAGRSIFFDLTHRFAGCDRFQLIWTKDTTQLAADDLGTNSSTTATSRFLVIRGGKPAEED